MIEYATILFEKVVELLKLIIPLYITFDIVGDLLWRKY